MTAQLSFRAFSVQLRPTALLSGVLSALIAAAVTRDNRVASSVGAGLLWYAADGIHVAGHVLSSQLVDAPMDGIDFDLYPKNVYYNNDVTPQQHIGRSVGGLVASLLAALLFMLLARSLPQGFAKKLATIVAIQNGLLFIAGMLPIPIVDGGVILANLRKLNG